MLKRRNYFILLNLLFASTAFSEILELNANYWARSTPDFISDKNKVDIFEKGNQVEVLESKKLPSGAEGLRVRLIKGVRGKVNDKEVWIYRSNYSHYIKKSYENDSDVQAKSKTEAGIKSPPCKDCEMAADMLLNNKNNLSEIAAATTEQLNQATETKKSTETISEKINHATSDLMQKIKNYSQSKQVQKVVTAAKNNAHRNSIGMCYRYVKNALSNGLTPGWFSDTAAKSGKETLKKFGFVNLLEHEPFKSQIKSPNQAPKGAVLVYSSGKPCRKSRTIKDCGHIEIKLDSEGKPGFASDYYSATAINDTAKARRYGSKYKLIGVMIKPMDGI